MNKIQNAIDKLEAIAEKFAAGQGVHGILEDELGEKAAQFVASAANGCQLTDSSGNPQAIYYRDTGMLMAGPTLTILKWIQEAGFSLDPR
jgi:hypothetical protein